MEASGEHRPVQKEDLMGTIYYRLSMSGPGPVLMGGKDLRRTCARRHVASSPACPTGEMRWLSGSLLGWSGRG